MEKANHESCGCYQCTHGAEATLKKEAEGMEKEGWYAHIVPDDTDCPFQFNYHTHGFVETLGHPDIQIVLPIDPNICHSIARTIFNLIREGNRFETGKQYDNILSDDYKVQFISATECERPVLRVILPDADGELKEDYARQLER